MWSCHIQLLPLLLYCSADEIVLGHLLRRRRSWLGAPYSTAGRACKPPPDSLGALRSTIRLPTPGQAPDSGQRAGMPGCGAKGQCGARPHTRTKPQHRNNFPRAGSSLKACGFHRPTSRGISLQSVRGSDNGGKHANNPRLRPSLRRGMAHGTGLSHSFARHAMRRRYADTQKLPRRRRSLLSDRVDPLAQRIRRARYR